MTPGQSSALPPSALLDQIRSARFRAEREAGWKRLDELVLRTESKGLHVLTYDEAQELASLYRQAMNALSVARAISMDKALLTYLDALCARAYLVVYAPQESLRGLFLRLLTHGIPQAARRSGPALLIGFLALILGGLLGAVLYDLDKSWFYTFVPGSLADGRTPEASTGYLRSTLFDGGSTDHDTLGSFATFLFSHNTQVAILTFALGIFITLPSFVLTFYNGLVLGAFWKMFADKGLAYELTGWLSIHGVTEMAAICIACAGGAAWAGRAAAGRDVAPRGPAPPGARCGQADVAGRADADLCRHSGRVLPAIGAIHRGAAGDRLGPGRGLVCLADAIGA